MSGHERKVETAANASAAAAETAPGLPPPAQRAMLADVRGVAPDSPLSVMLRGRAVKRLAIATPRADAALRRLAQRGVKARLIGSMARGAFRSTSDVDFLIEDPGPLGEDAIEDIIRLEMGEFPFDIAFQSKISPRLKDHHRLMAHPIFARLDAQLQQVEDELRNLGTSHSKSVHLRENHIAMYDEWTHRSALAEGIRSVYGGLESVMKAIADEIDGYEAPQSENWHEKLIDQMSVPIENTRGAVLSSNTKSLLHELRRFRHGLHHNYAQTLEMSKVLENFERLNLAYPAFRRDYDRLSGELQKAVQSGPGSAPG